MRRIWRLTRRLTRECARTVVWQMLVWLRTPRGDRGLVSRLMQSDTPNGHHADQPAPQMDAHGTPAPDATNGHNGGDDASAAPRRMRVLLVRHGQSTYNVEGRLPSQLPGVALTDLGRSQALRAAVALSGLPLSAVISSPLERARDTATIIARGWGLEVRLDDRLMDTNVGPWAGKLIADLEKDDPTWKAFVAHPSQPPEGVESLEAVMARAVAVVDDLRHDPSAGEYVALVAHADIVKLIVAHYMGIAVDCAPFLHVDNAAISALGFDGERPPKLLALNWTPLPSWLAPWQQGSAPASGERVDGAVQASEANDTDMVADKTSADKTSADKTSADNAPPATASHQNTPA